MKCPNCGKEIADSARFCPHCGSEQLHEKHCAHCGATLKPEARFCPNCGQPVSDNQPPQTNQPNPANRPNQPNHPNHKNSRRGWIIVIVLLALAGAAWYAYSEMGLGRGLFGGSSRDGGEIANVDADDDDFVDDFVDDIDISEYGFLGIALDDTVGTIVREMTDLGDEDFNANPADYQGRASLNLYLKVDNNVLAIAAIFREAVGEQAYTYSEYGDQESYYRFKPISPQYIYFVLGDEHLNGRLGDVYENLKNKVRDYGSLAAQNDNAIITQSGRKTYVVVNTGDGLAYYVGYLNPDRINISPFQSATKDSPVTLDKLSLDEAM